MAHDTKTLGRISLPYNGIWHFAPEPRFEEIVVFVHFYGGSRSTSRRHVDFVNELGFHAVTFDLSFNRTLIPERIPWDSRLKVGYIHVWKEEIQNVLNHVPGRKILFGFSNPSGAMILAAAARGAVDIAALICDGGPFLNGFKILMATAQSDSKHFPWPKKLAIVFCNQMIFGRSYSAEVTAALQRIPAALPILSIRSWKDQLVPYSAIEDYFALGPHLNLQVLGLTEAEHLEGLKRHPDEYRPRARRFLESVATPISS